MTCPIFSHVIIYVFRKNCRIEGGYSGFSGWIIKKMQKKYQVRIMVAHPLPNFVLIIINTL